MTARLQRTFVAVALVLATALVPVAYGSLVRERWESCRDPVAIADTAAIPGSVPQDEGKPVWLADGVFLHRRGELDRRTPANVEIPYELVRSDNATQVFAEPSRPLSRPLDPDQLEIHRIDVDGESVPVHVEQQALPGYIHIAAYVFEYDGRAVETLLPMQLRTAAAQIVNGTRPITQYAIHAMARKGHPEDALEPAFAWLTEAWRRHRAVCLQ
jgi:hypothetical protein